MLDAIRHVASFVDFSAHRTGREQLDASAQKELSARPLALPRGLELEWLGTAGYRLAFEGSALFIDPYLSRAPLTSVLRGHTALPDRALVDRLLGGKRDKVVGVLVGHCHFDHAIDTPEVARRFVAPALGSKSLVNLMTLHGLGHLAVEVEPHRPYELGPFTVRFTPSAHSKLVLGYAVPYDGELTCEHLDALTPAAYRCGRTWGIHVEVAGTSFYHQGSANLIDDEIKARGVEVFLAGISGRRFTRDYWARILPRLEPRLVVASHFDDFFRPVDGSMGYSPNVNLAAVPEEIARVSKDFALASLEPLRPVRGS